ncbi:MAG TPA: hypothetical protein VHR45_10730 [Thermoanaerobaculia bacterium]|nr:hypothetical protein [Thermoanaerobaculia bacterium]
MTRALAAATLAALVLVTLAAAPSRGDELADLQGTLARFPGTDEVRATLELQLSRRARDENWSEHSRVSVEIEDSPRGLNVEFPRALARQAQQELHAQILDPDKRTPTYTAMQAVSLNEIAAILDCSATLAQDLPFATLLQATAGTYSGKPARLLVLSITPRLSREARKHVKSAESKMSIWLGADGLPLGAERTDRTRATFLLLSFENLRKQAWTFGRKGNRLVAVRHEVSDNASGLGQDFQSTTITTLTVH